MNGQILHILEDIQPSPSPSPPPFAHPTPTQSPTRPYSPCPAVSIMLIIAPLSTCITSAHYPLKWVTVPSPPPPPLLFPKIRLPFAPIMSRFPQVMYAPIKCILSSFRPWWSFLLYPYKVRLFVLQRGSKGMHAYLARKLKSGGWFSLCGYKSTKTQ